MSLDVQSELRSQTHAVEVDQESSAFFEQVESVLLVLASTLAAVTISALWVVLSLS